jgi:hypothetical protein
VRFLFHLHDESETYRVTSLLKGRGIPVFVRSSRPIGRAPYRVAVFVCLDRHYEDACALLRNPNHAVAEPVDVEAFDRSIDSAPTWPILKVALIALGVVVPVFAAVIYFHALR